MSKFPLDLNSLAPREVTFSLSGLPDRQLTLSKWTLRVRAWAFDKYGAEKLKDIFENHRIVEISEIAFFMIKEKNLFKSVEDFQEMVVTTADHLTLTKALLGSVGIGEPEIEKINADIEKKAQALAKSSPNPKSRKK